MKKKVFNKKMNLNKEIVVSLSGSKMNALQGGNATAQNCTFPDCSGVGCPLPTRVVDLTCFDCCTDLTCTTNGYGCYSAGISCP